MRDRKKYLSILLRRACSRRSPAIVRAGAGQWKYRLKAGRPVVVFPEPDLESRRSGGGHSSGAAADWSRGIHFSVPAGAFGRCRNLLAVHLVGSVIDKLGGL